MEDLHETSSGIKVFLLKGNSNVDLNTIYDIVTQARLRDVKSKLITADILISNIP